MLLRMRAVDMVEDAGFTSSRRSMPTRPSPSWNPGPISPCCSPTSRCRAGWTAYARPRRPRPLAADQDHPGIRAAEAHQPRYSRRQPFLRKAAASRRNDRRDTEPDRPRLTAGKPHQKRRNRSIAAETAAIDLSGRRHKVVWSRMFEIDHQEDRHHFERRRSAAAGLSGGGECQPSAAAGAGGNQRPGTARPGRHRRPRARGVRQAAKADPGRTAPSHQEHAGDRRAPSPPRACATWPAPNTPNTPSRAGCWRWGGPTICCCRRDGPAPIFRKSCAAPPRPSTIRMRRNSRLRDRISGSLRRRDRHCDDA